MPRVRRSFALAAIISAALACGLFVAGCDRTPSAQEILAAAPAAADTAEARLHISYPLDGTLFPPESVAPTFVWEDTTAHVDRWDVVVRDASGENLLHATIDTPRWRPSEDDWKRIKHQSLVRDAEVSVAGVDRTTPASVLSSVRVHIRTSKDEVGDSLFYREVPL